ncbi:MAG: ABC transporter permease [Phycisphaerales bacterium]|nr:ABC transporter permease [Phycisphaerales bacterium]
MSGHGSCSGSWRLPLVVVATALLLWYALSATGIFLPWVFPPPARVATGFGEELRTGRLPQDIVVSLFRVGAGFGAAVVLGVPIGLLLAHRPRWRVAFSPAINFFRCLSPLAWIPFAILWFGIGDLPAIFLIFLSSIFPLILATMVAVDEIPSVYFRVAHEHGIGGWELARRVTFPAILPQLITALRVTAGVAWLVVVAAEMVAGRDGLGFAIMDARNGLRIDLVVVGMIVIGAIGVVIDRLITNLTRMPNVRWGYER